MYDGWLTVAGVEIVNRARSIAYKDALLPTLYMADCSECLDLPAAIGDTEPYVDPVTDEAPWYDPDTPGSDEFIGFIPQSMLGFEDSTRTAAVFQSVLDGGHVGKVRKATKEMRVSGALVAASQAGTSAGLSWLTAVLDGNLCNTCDDSDDVCFFTACPRLGEDPDDFIRHLRRVKCTAGPTVISENELSCGGYMVVVEFTLVAGTPHVFGEPIMVAAATGSTLTPILAGSEVFEITSPLEQCYAAYDRAVAKSVLRDPDCPPIPSPPTAPILSNACRPLSFDYFAYPPQKTTWLVASANYNSRPFVARNTVTDDYLIVYARHTTNAGTAVSSTSTIKGKTSTDGQTWSSEYTLYDEGGGLHGSIPAGIAYMPGPGKFIVGAQDVDLAATDKSFGQYRGVILTSPTGLSGSWTAITDLDDVMRRYGMSWYVLGDVAHFDNNSANGVTYAAVSGYRNTGTGKADVLLLRSMDAGSTWQVLSVMFASATYNYINPQIAIWPDGAIGMVALNWNTQQVVFRRSQDGGRTWSDPTAVAAQADQKTVPAPVITNDGTIMVMVSSINVKTGRNLGTHSYRWSRDRGRTWSAVQRFANDFEHGSMGADWTVGPTGDLLAVYSLDYSATSAQIRSLYFPQIERYFSYAIGVPDNALKAWSEGAMLLQVRTGAKPTRQMRIRLVPRAFDDQPIENIDPCSICSGFIIDYAPANTLVYVDGMTQRVTMAVGNKTAAPADHLVSGEYGQVFEWPTFTCGTGYFVVIDVDVETVVDVALAVVNRE